LFTIISAGDIICHNVITQDSGEVWQELTLPQTFNDSDLFRNRMPEAGRKGTKAALV